MGKINDVEWCENCEKELATYELGGKHYCSECLLEKLEENKQLQSMTVTHFMINDEYIGNNHDDDFEQLVEKIAKQLKVKNLNK